MSTCRKCLAEIQWMVTLAGKKMPCDTKLVYVSSDPVHAWAEGANPIRRAIIVTDSREVRRGWVTATGVGRHRGWESHFETCLFAKKLRRPER